MKKPLIVANWKQNPQTIGEAKALFLAIRKVIKAVKGSRAIIAPPFPFIAELRKLSMGKSTELAAQTVSEEKGGPFTGEVSALMLKSLGVSHVIVGHSETRARGDTDERINAKVKAVLKAELTAILCVGEEVRDHGGHYFSIVEEQLRTCLKDVRRNDLGNLIIAYEPVWAISKGDGKGATATPEHAHEMKLFIQKVLADLFGRSAIHTLPILYGGSVNPQNVESLSEKSEMDGFLVGGASIRPKEFGVIVQVGYGRP